MSKWFLMYLLIVKAFSIVCVKFKLNFSLKSYFFYFVQSLFKTPSIWFSISSFILFKYYFFINFLLLFLLNWNQTTTQKKPTSTKKKPTATSSTVPSNLTQKNPANLQTFTEVLQKIIVNLQTFITILQKERWQPVKD